MFSYEYDNNSLINVNVDLPQTGRLNHRRSLDYGTTSFSLAGPNASKNPGLSQQNSIPSSPSHAPNFSNSTQIPKNMIFIRRQSSDKYLQKRHSVDSNTSDPGYSFTNNKSLLSPSQQISPRESNSPKSCHSSIASVAGRNSSCSSVAFLSRQSSTNSSKLPTQQELDENLQNNKWFSSSSVLLTRVKSMKEKFRRVVVQSVQPDDWPPPSILFSDRYRCPSNSSFQSGSSMKTSSTTHRSHPPLVKSKSIDPSSFQTNFTNTKKTLKSFSPAGSGRYFKRERLQRSLTSYTETLDSGIGNENGIVCSDMDLKAIISTFKKEVGSMTLNKYDSNSVADENMSITQKGSKTPVGTSSAIGSGFGKRKLMRKQVSFDDEQGVMMMNRKVSAIAEEIECHNTFENNQSESRIDVRIDEINSFNNRKLKEENGAQCYKDMSEEDDENCAPNDSCHLPLLPKEVEFDEYGQTWEIYGADPDPEILGQAIQLHLERLMVCRQVVSVPNGDVSRQKSVSVAESKEKMENNDISIRVFKPLRVDMESPENNLRFIARRLCGKWSCFSGHQESGNKIISGIDQDL